MNTILMSLVLWWWFMHHKINLTKSSFGMTLITTIIQNHNSLSFVLGDFNEVRSSAERMGCTFDNRGVDKFNAFIHNSCLCDIPMCGKRFTRMNRTGSKHSKIDCILVSQHYIDLWPNSHVLALPREFSDHSPLLLTNSSSTLAQSRSNSTTHGYTTMTLLPSFLYLGLILWSKITATQLSVSSPNSNF
ncbi:cytochrome P450 [Artemisia annua]|uniref:Cytochrome P450 n=1 Tax=Artemisia annua TaxID=35608 RepID=A0A2U1LQS8_ARTAN|nr:cytochrome P450 [Artemisia annua]